MNAIVALGSLPAQDVANMLVALKSTYWVTNHHVGFTSVADSAKSNCLILVLQTIMDLRWLVLVSGVASSVRVTCRLTAHVPKIKGGLRKSLYNYNNNNNKTALVDKKKINQTKEEEK